MELKDIQTIVQFLKENDILEFELKRGEDFLKLSRGRPAPTMMAPQAQSIASYAHLEPAFAANAGVAAATSSSAGPTVGLNPNLRKVESPIVGTFYRKSSPDAPLFAKEGDKVRKGQTLCIVEAMKVMNEIESPCEGTIEKILPADGEVIEYGEVLFLINP